MYCKGGSAEEPIEVVKLEGEDDSYTETEDYNHIDETPGIAPEEKDILVKA